MSKKKNKKQAEQGIYAFCMTVGVIVGFGLGAIAGGILVSVAIGLIVGGVAAYIINRPRKARKH